MIGYLNRKETNQILLALSLLYEYHIIIFASYKALPISDLETRFTNILVASTLSIRLILN